MLRDRSPRVAPSRWRPFGSVPWAEVSLAAGGAESHAASGGRVAEAVRFQQSRRWLRPATALLLCSMMSSAVDDVLTSALTRWQKPTVHGDLCCLTERPALRARPLLPLYGHLDGTSGRRWSRKRPSDRASPKRRSSRHPPTHQSSPVSPEEESLHAAASIRQQAAASCV